MPTQTFSERESPLIFVNGPHCLGVTEEVVFDFEIELIDANGVATNPYHAPFTCLPQ